MAALSAAVRPVSACVSVIVGRQAAGHRRPPTCAAKAGWETVLVDRREAAAGGGLADAHVITDVTADEARTRSLVASCDAVLPACEDEPTCRVGSPSALSAWRAPRCSTSTPTA